MPSVHKVPFGIRYWTFMPQSIADLKRVSRARRIEKHARKEPGFRGFDMALAVRNIMHSWNCELWRFEEKISWIRCLEFEGSVSLPERYRRTATMATFHHHMISKTARAVLGIYTITLICSIFWAMYSHPNAKFPFSHFLHKTLPLPRPSRLPRSLLCTAFHFLT
jgi:hypothetical protein